MWHLTIGRACFLWLKEKGSRKKIAISILQYDSESCQYPAEVCSDELWRISRNEENQTRLKCWHHDRSWGPRSRLNGLLGKQSKSEPEEECIHKKSGGEIVRFWEIHLFVLKCVWSDSAPDEATLKVEARALQCTTKSQNKAIPTNFYVLTPCAALVDSVCGLGPDIIGVHTLNPATRYKSPSNSKHSRQRPSKKKAAHECDRALIFAELRMERKILESFHSSRHHGDTRYCATLRPWCQTWRNLRKTRNSRLPRLNFNSNSKTLPNHCFCVPPEFLGQSTRSALHRFCLSWIVRHVLLGPGLTVGSCAILCNDGLCTEQRFHVEGEAQMCRVGPDEPDSLAIQRFSSAVFPPSGDKRLCYHREVLSFFTWSRVFYEAFISVLNCGNGCQRCFSLFSQSPAGEIWIILGTLGTAWKKNIRFMTVITPIYVHRVPIILLDETYSGSPSTEIFVYWLPKARYPHLSYVRTTTRESSNNFQIWTISEHAANACLRTNLVRTYNSNSLVHNWCWKISTRYVLPCNMFTITRKILEIECADVVAALSVFGLESRSKLFHTSDVSLLIPFHT